MVVGTCSNTPDSRLFCAASENSDRLGLAYIYSIYPSVGIAARI